MYYYLIVVKKMYIVEPHDPSTVHVSGPMKAVIYVGLAGTLFIGIYPQPAADWVVAATMMFANVGGSAALPDLSAVVTAGH
jgi:NADH-quinone oxidoreductase subunit N